MELYSGMKLSPNFTVDEIVPQNYIHKIDDSQHEMLENICINILEPIRIFASLLAEKDCPIKITSGLRTQAEYDDLIKRGYNPSKKSDHFYDAKKGCFGAVDFVTNIIPTNLLFYSIFDNFSSIYFGQIILERNYHNTYWIHVSNPPELFGGKPRKNNRILISLDNGKTYNAPK